MKVLFIASGNKGRMGHNFRNQYLGISPLVDATSVYLVKGKGLTGYLRNILPLRRLLEEFKPDIVHAHYSLCGYLAVACGCKHTVVSLMGTDCSKRLFVWLNKMFHRFFWKYVIVKSSEMQSKLSIHSRLSVIPNGVDLEHFRHIDRDLARQHVGFIPDLWYVVFVGDPVRKEKNFQLAREAFSLLPDEDTRLHVVFDVQHTEMPFYYRASDALLLTSRHEGSPNAIKEAMACDLPIISTDVGDVRENLRGLENCYIVNNDPLEIAKVLGIVRQAATRPEGRSRILALGLDSISINSKIVGIYKTICENKRRSG